MSKSPISRGTRPDRPAPGVLSAYPWRHPTLSADRFYSQHCEVAATARTVGASNASGTSYNPRPPALGSVYHYMIERADLTVIEGESHVALIPEPDVSDSLS